MRTNAFDLGYVTQTLWNTGQGRLFRFSTLDGVAFRPEGLDPATLRQPNSLLAFHVEPVLIPISWLYRLMPDPRMLLWFQSLVLAIGALPMAMIGRAIFGGWLAGFVIAGAYLLAPGLEGAALSDFHAVALAATWLAWMLWAIESNRPRLGILFGAITVLSREDAALLVAWLGAILLCKEAFVDLSRYDRSITWTATASRSIVMKWRSHALGLPLALFLGGGLWAAACFGVIAPRFNGGGSVFWYRYAWMGESPLQALRSILNDPRPLTLWIASSDVSSYLAIQVLTGGIWCLFAPIQLLIAAPIVLMNALSSFEWMRSGGAHYSAILVPVLVWSGAHGAKIVIGKSGRFGKSVVLSIFALSAFTAQLWIGVSPFRSGQAFAAVESRNVRALTALTSIPADAEVSATSALYPHLSARTRLFWFPAHADANWLAIDALGITHPLTARETRALVQSAITDGRYTVESAAGGAIVLRQTADSANIDIRGQVDSSLERIMLSLFDVAVMDQTHGRDDFRGVTPIMPPTRFGESLEMVGYRLTEWPEIGLSGGEGILETYWLSNQPMGEELRFSLATTRFADGAIVGIQGDAAPLAVWFPTSSWPVKKIVRLSMKVANINRVPAAGIIVSHADGTRLPIQSESPADDRPLWENNTIAGLEIDR